MDVGGRECWAFPCEALSVPGVPLLTLGVTEVVKEADQGVEPITTDAWGEFGHTVGGIG